MRKNVRFKQKMLRISFFILLIFACLVTVNAQSNKPSNESSDLLISPGTCEDWLARIGNAVQQWEKNKDTTLIIIARLGSKENSRRIILKRIKTLKQFILDPKYNIKAVFTEGERTKDFGTVEFYVEGKLLYSLQLLKNEDIPLRFCNRQECNLIVFCTNKKTGNVLRFAHLDSIQSQADLDRAWNTKIANYS